MVMPAVAAAVAMARLIDADDLGPAGLRRAHIPIQEYGTSCNARRRWQHGVHDAWQERAHQLWCCRCMLGCAGRKHAARTHALTQACWSSPLRQVAP